MSTWTGAQTDFVMLLPEAAACTRHETSNLAGTMAAASRDGWTEDEKSHAASAKWSFVFVVTWQEPTLYDVANEA